MGKNKLMIMFAVTILFTASCSSGDINSQKKKGQYIDQNSYQRFFDVELNLDQSDEEYNELIITCRSIDDRYVYSLYEDWYYNKSFLRMDFHITFYSSEYDMYYQNDQYYLILTNDKPIYQEKRQKLYNKNMVVDSWFVSSFEAYAFIDE